MSAKNRSFKFIMVFLLWVFNSFLRICFGLLTIVDSPLDVEVSPFVLSTIIVMFLFLGITGFITSYGFWKMDEWGIRGVIIVCIITIIFDIWGITIQFTAALGFFTPTITLIYIYLRFYHPNIKK